MKVRCISPDELNEFCGLGLGDEEARLFRTRLLRSWEEKRSYPEWCFVLEEQGGFIGRVAFDVFPSEPLNLMVWRYYIPEGDGFLEKGAELFRGAIEALAGKGLRSIEYHLYGTGDKKFDDARDLFLGAGFEIRQQKKNYKFTEGKLGEMTDRLVFKALAEVGEEAFINAIERVTKGTLDAYDEKDFRTMGSHEAARNYYYGLRDIQLNEEWWKLAYEQKGDFVGLIVPQRFNEKLGAINYIGVEPDKRGRGYVMDLLLMGTATLKNDGVENIIADIDINNSPMENALTTAGYRFNKKELVLTREL